MSFLPKEVVLYLLEFVEYRDRVEFIVSCSQFYISMMKTNVRQLKVREFYGETIDRINQFIADPFNQLSFFLNRITGDYVAALADFNYCLHKLSCNDIYFLKILKSSNRLRLRTLELEMTADRASTSFFREDTGNSFLNVANCETLSLNYLRNADTLIPYIPSIKSLSVEFQDASLPSNPGVFVNYSSHLNHLCLTNCNMTDVSMLGSIPHLELIYCHRVTDITSLTNNDQVKIEYCNSIMDYSHSFSNSRNIEIKLPILGDGPTFYFDMTKWIKVQYVNLETMITCKIYHRNSNQIPKSVKRCYLSGSFVTSVDFNIPSLTEIQLSNNNTLASLEECGLERVAVIECFNMEALQSLQGLGRGRNRKVGFRHCHKITDFSPLNHVPIVEINYCAGFTNPLQVRCVHDLIISPVKQINFSSFGYSRNPYESVYSLTLFNSAGLIEMFDGLETIPYLEMDIDGYGIIRSFLDEGKRLLNHQIVLMGYQDRHRNFKRGLKLDILDLHNRFMKTDYKCINLLPKKWIWTRKKEY